MTIELGGWSAVVFTILVAFGFIVLADALILAVLEVGCWLVRKIRKQERP